MIRFYTFCLLFICSLSFAQLVNNGTLENDIASNETNNNIIFSNEMMRINKDTTKAVVIDTLKKANSIVYPPTTRDYRKLGYNTSIYVGAAVISFGILWAMPESVSNWNKQEIRDKGFFWKWKQNVKAGPIWDHDAWQLNYLAHPYCGGIYYMTARSSGFTILESFAYSALMSSLFWEYGIEAFAEIPSKQDLVVTPVLGSVVGEGFFYAKKSILRHDHKILKSKFLGYTALVLMDPFNTILDSFGYQQKVKTQMNIAPVGFDAHSNKTIMGVNFSARF